MSDFATPIPEAVFYEDEKLYACLASEPVTKGHCLVVWKDNVKDLHLLSRQDYDYLMEKVDLVRNTLIKVLKVKKVYLMYMDEANHVHWHLIPRYNQEGFNILKHNPGKLEDFSLARKLKTINMGKSGGLH